MENAVKQAAIDPGEVLADGLQALTRSCLTWLKAMALNNAGDDIATSIRQIQQREGLQLESNGHLPATGTVVGIGKAL